MRKLTLCNARHGQVISCFDSANEHPPYSWPKDHPERESAIAEQKRKRKQRIIDVGEGVQTVKVNPQSVVSSPPPPPKSDPIVAKLAKPAVVKPTVINPDEKHKTEVSDNISEPVRFADLEGEVQQFLQQVESLTQSVAAKSISPVPRR